MMWNTAYGYPTPANHPKPIIPAFPVMVSVSESSTTDLEVTFKPSPKYKSKIQSDGEITVKRHHHHSSRHRYYYQGDTEGGQSSSLSFPLPTFQSQSSSSPMPTPYGHTESQTRDVQLPQPIYFPGSHGSGSNINSPDQLLVHPRSIQPTRQAHPTQPSAQAPIEMPEPNQNRKPKASAKPKRPGPRPVQTPMKTSVTMPGSNPKPPSNAVVRSSSAVPGPSSSGLDRGTDRRRKRALCIGINYIGQEWFLRGCINDARSVRNFLIEYCGFPRENIVILTDSAGSPGSPTKNNILKMMRWLVKGARPGDSLFFHFSGHGGQVADRDGDEKDGMDEVIYPVDYRKNGEIVDDDMHAIMVKHLPEGCRLTALFDSCHSGTALDLPFVYSTSGRLKSGKLTKAGAARESRADVVSWSGCKDGQTSKDTMNPDGIAVGAMSHAFIHALKRNSRLSYTNLLQDLRHELVVHNQKPQLSTSHRINPNEIFYI